MFCVFERFEDPLDACFSGDDPEDELATALLDRFRDEGCVVAKSFARRLRGVGVLYEL